MKVSVSDKFFYSENKIKKISMLSDLSKKTRKNTEINSTKVFAGLPSEKLK